MEQYINTNCKYTYNRFKDVVYLFDENHTKLIYDGSLCMIEELSQTPLQLNVRDVELKESSSLDERYKFDKTLTFSFDGFYDHHALYSKYFAIVEDYEGTRWVVNVDFPSYVTYQFDLQENVYETNYTLRSQSNFPTMKLVSDFDYEQPECFGYMVNGIDSMKLLERAYTDLDISNRKVITYGVDFKKVEPLKGSMHLSQSFDGRDITDTLTFTIPFDAFQYGWHYNLQHFIYNKYSAIITPNSKRNQFFVGFNHGLQPTYTVDKENDAHTITITMVEVSNLGLTAANDYSEENNADTGWVNIKKVNGMDAYECVGAGEAMYILQEEMYENGMPTGNYKVKEGYESMFPDLNIVGTFTDDYYFNSPSCVANTCQFNTSIPSVIEFSTLTSLTFSITSLCGWEFTDIPPYITVSPSSGNGDGSVTITSNSIPSSGGTYVMYIVSDGGYRVPITVRLTGEDDGKLHDKYINCLAQEVVFNIQNGYSLRVNSITGGATYWWESGRLVVSVPKNTSTTSSVTYTLSVTDSNSTYNVQIIQDRMYESWIANGETMCDEGNLYTAEELWTGTTSSSSSMHPTGQMRKGELIPNGSGQCIVSDERWVNYGNVTCMNGDEWTLEEQEITENGGLTWTKTGNVRLGYLVQEDSPICDESAITYSWVLSNEYVCEDAIPEESKAILYTTNGTVVIPCDTSSTLSRSDIVTHADVSAITSVEIGECVTALGPSVFNNCTAMTSVTFNHSLITISDAAFRYCSALTEVTLTSAVQTIGEGAFYHCSSLRSILLPNTITQILEGAFSNCTSLTSCTIPDSVTGTNLGDAMFYGCTSLRTLQFSPYLNYIGESTCENCYNLEFVTVPFAVQNIGNFAFSNCNKLTVTMENYMPCTLDLGTSSYYHHFDNVRSISVPSQSVQTYANAAGWNEYSNKLTGH